MNEHEKIRYRTEAFSGQQYRDAAEVMAFETFEMGNVDILETLSNGILKDSEDISRQCVEFIDEFERNGFIDDFSAEDGVNFYKNVLSEIRRVTGHDIKYALWLADLDTVKNFYGKNMMFEDDYDAYEVGQVVLSELGYDGTLYGYTDFPEPIFLKEKTYFHVTLMENVPSILEHGLVPQIGERAEEFGETEPAIYLFPSKDDMNNALYNWLGEWYNDNYGEDCELAILHIRLGKNVPVFQTEAEYERICKVVIPPEAISFYDELGNELPRKRDEPVREAVQTYEGAIEFLYDTLNYEEGGETDLTLEEFSPVFESTNYFCIYCYNFGDEYYLVSKDLGECELVLDRCPPLFGRNNLISLSGEKILDIADEELLRELVLDSRDGFAHFIPESELTGLHVLEELYLTEPVDSIFEDVKNQLETAEMKTEHGEPKARVRLENGRSFEVTLEQSGLPEYEFCYSAKLRCSEKELYSYDFLSSGSLVKSFFYGPADDDELRDLIVAILVCNMRLPTEINEKTVAYQSLSCKIAAAESKRTAKSERTSRDGLEPEQDVGYCDRI